MRGEEQRPKSVGMFYTHTLACTHVYGKDLTFITYQQRQTGALENSPKPILSPNHPTPSLTFHPIPSITIPTLLRLANSLVYSLSKVFNVVRVQTSHRDTPVLRHVDVGVLSDLQHLLLC
jgi:hypothetical protein